MTGTSGSNSGAAPPPAPATPAPAPAVAAAAAPAASIPAGVAPSATPAAAPAPASAGAAPPPPPTTPAASPPPPVASSTMPPPPPAVPATQPVAQPNPTTSISTLNWSQTKTHLLSPSLTLSLTTASELRERLDIVHTTEYPLFLKTLLPVFTTLLTTTTTTTSSSSFSSSKKSSFASSSSTTTPVVAGVSNAPPIPPSPTPTSTPHRLRNTLLEILTRLPHNEYLRPYAPTLLTLAFDILNKDYEENALLASRVVFDLHKSFRPVLVDFVQPFLDFVVGVYRGLGTSVQRNFLFPKCASTASSTGNGGTPSSSSSPPPPPATSSSITTLSLKSSASFRVLTECPLTVMLLFQLYPKYLKSNIPTFIPLMMEALALCPPPRSSVITTSSSSSSENKQKEEEAQQQQHYHEINKLYHIRTRDFIASQVKTLSFLTYLLRGFTEQMKPYEDRIATNVVSLLRTCPRDATSTRKELLVATRHILATEEFRGGFFKYVDPLLDERVLLGSHRASECLSLRPLGYSTLADLIHHVRGGLNTRQLSRVIHLFSRVLHSSYEGSSSSSGSGSEGSLYGMPWSIQMTSVRLLLNLVDHIFHNRDAKAQVGRDLLVRILDVLVGKFDTLRVVVEGVLKMELDKKRKLRTLKDETKEKDDMEVMVEEETTTSVPPFLQTKRKSVATIGTPYPHTTTTTTTTTSHSEEEEEESLVRDLQLLLKPMILGLKTVIWCVNNYGYQRAKEEKKKAAAAAAAAAAAGATTPAVPGAVVSGVEPTPVVVPPTTTTTTPAATATTAATPGENGEVASAMQKMTNSERELVDKYILWAPFCLRIFELDVSDGGSAVAAASSSSSASGAGGGGGGGGGGVPSSPSSSSAAAAGGGGGGLTSSPSKKYTASPGTFSSMTQTKPIKRNVALYKEMLEMFAASLSVLDGFNLRRTVGPRLNHFFDLLLDNDEKNDNNDDDDDEKKKKKEENTWEEEEEEVITMCIPKYILMQSKLLSFDFCDILLGFLLEEKMADLRESDNKKDKQKAMVILQLFECIFASMVVHPKNEGALRPRLQSLVAMCLRSATEENYHSSTSSSSGKRTKKKWPGNYYILLRSLFRSISGGKFEESYKEILPLLPTILNGLYRIYLNTDDEDLRFAIVELCLTIPARLSSLLPHLSLLLRIIIPALKSDNGDLVNLGLRTLEFWVDNLNPDFLYPILAQQTPVLTELMISLTNHLRPAPYPYGLLTLRLLGKLGGRNRRFLQESMNMDVKNEDGYDVPVLSIECAWKKSPDVEYRDENKEGENEGNNSNNNAEKGSNVNENDDAMEIETDGADGKPEEEEKKEETPDDDLFALPLPVERAVEVLKIVSCAPELVAAPKPAVPFHDDGADVNVGVVDSIIDTPRPPSMQQTMNKLTWKDLDKMMESKVENLDLTAYCIDVMNETKRHQSRSAFSILRAALATVLDVDESDIIAISTGNTQDAKPQGSVPVNSADEKGTTSGNVSSFPTSPPSCYDVRRDDMLRLVCDGLFHAALHSDLEEEALVLLKGLTSHIFFILSSHQEHIVGIDANGNEIPRGGNSSFSYAYVINGKLQPMKPFGCFRFSGPLKDGANPLIVNKAIVDAMCRGCERSEKVALEIIMHVAELSRKMCEKSPSHGNISPGADIFFESLLGFLCQACLSKQWNHRQGAYSGLSKLLVSLGPDWARKYEVEIMHAALFGVKDSPREIFSASMESLSFYMRTCCFLYGRPVNAPSLIYDVLSLPEKGSTSSSTVPPTTSEPIGHSDQMAPSSTPEAVLHLLISELASSKHSVRFIVRHSFRHFSGYASSMEGLLMSHASTIKRHLLIRSLRILPLPEQVSVVEALAFIVDQVPNLIKFSDQHFLAFLSELLKMLSIADGEMSDPSFTGVVIDKNGHAGSSSSSTFSQGSPSVMLSNASSRSHASAIFLRGEFELDVDGRRVVVPAELPYGIQLRVSALMLFRAVIRRHTNEFFDAAPSTQIGNIRPHVISLLFRSLISNPPQAVTAAHAALKDVLSLGVTSREGAQSLTHRLPKELLQTCIKPVLLNLKDYTKLTVPLLRGLSRLLSLLSSWFNKTLGEKLIAHLQKFADPERIIGHMIWREGDEPLVAAAIMDLFELLPQGPHFVENLVKTTINLEAALPRYKPCGTCSPYRPALARYLNRHCGTAAAFFLQEERLKDPLYSDLFQDILKRKDSRSLRSHLSGKECSNVLLNVCFERPLAIIRSEKTAVSAPGKSSSSPPRSAAEILSLHGINIDTTSSSQRQREFALRQELEMKQKKLQMMQQEEVRTKDVYNNAAGPGAAPVESQAAIQEAKRQHHIAQQAREKAQKEVNDAKQLYASEIAKTSKQPGKTADSSVTGESPRSMNTVALELQHQGFKLVETLISNDPDYLKDHNDVMRAFRWLWRSKGRHLRLLHEESMPPRYHNESKMLANFLVKYSQAYVNDVDVLFDLLRIFLQPTATDFSFVKKFLQKMVSEVLNIEQKRHVMARFFALLASEGTEETKVLSIQLVVLPMLRSDFEKLGSRPCHDDGQPPSKDSWINEMNKLEDYRNLTGRHEKSSETMGEVRNVVVDENIIRKFMKDALFRGGQSSRHYGDRLNVELLKLSSILLEYIWANMIDHRKDLIKFAWNLLKSEDVNTKHWAYVNVSSFVAVFETPAKIILQVYVALLRAHQQESKELVRSALDILLPALPRRLQVDDFQKAMKYTNKIMYEEGNSVPQLAHIWQTITRHPGIFYFHRHHFVPHMVNSLNKLGLPPNSPQENRELSVSLVELVLKWEETREEQTNAPKEGISSPLLQSERKRSADDAVSSATEISDETATKKLKLDDGSSVRVETSAKESTRIKFTLDPGMVDTMANFLVRLVLLIADSKADSMQRKLGLRAVTLFQCTIFRWKRSSIQFVYFDKVINMCIKESTDTIASSSAVLGATEKKSKEKASKGKGSGKGSNKSGSGKSSSKASSSKQAVSAAAPTAKTKEEPKPISIGLLTACLDIFIVLLQCPAQHQFLLDNSTKVMSVLKPCFTRAVKGSERDLRRRLKRFLTLLFMKSPPQNDLIFQAKVLIEMTIMSVTKANLKSAGVPYGNNPKTAASPNDDGSKEDEEDAFEIGRVGGHCSVFFLIQIIEDVCLCGQPEFVESFAGSCLIALAENLSKSHIQAATWSNRNVTTTMQMGGSGFHQVPASPVCGVLEEACDIGFDMSAAGNNIGKNRRNQDENKRGVKNVPEVGTALRSLITCVRLIGSSSVPFSFTANRKLFFHIISNILDMSDNIQLLLTTVSLIGKWLTANGCGIEGPMTSKERNSFVWKMTSFDFRGLPEAATQPLIDMVCYILLSLHNWDSSLPVEFPFEGNNLTNLSSLDPPAQSTPQPPKGNSNKQRKKTDHNTDILLGRSLMSCLLCTNPQMRSLLVGLFGTQSSDCKELYIQLAELSKQIGCCQGDSLQAVGIPGRSPIDMLWQLLHSDFEGLGGRLWSLVFVEFLIACSRHHGGLHLVCDNYLAKEGTSLDVTDSCSPGSPAEKYVHSWLVGPKTRRACNNDPTDTNATVSVSQIDDVYNTFKNIILREKNDDRGGRGRCLAAIRALAHGNAHLCQDYFERLLFAAWKRLPSNEARLALIPALESLLARPFHSQFLKQSGGSADGSSRGLNAIQSSLRALSKIRPMPMLDADLLVSLATDFNAWHEVISMLEHQYCILKDNSSVNSLGYQNKLLGVIRHCYDALGESDISLALACDSCNLPGTKWAVSLEMYGKVNEAVTEFNGLIDQAESGQISLQPSEEELALWESRWVELHRELCQWPVIEDYAETTGSPKLLLESAWKARKWDKVRSLCSTPSIVAALEAGDPEVKMSEIFLAIEVGKLNEVENLHAQTAQLCLYKWQLLPSIAAKCNAHLSLLQCFHRLVELRESGQIMVETSTHSKGGTLPDLKNLLSAWRHRLPNDFDSITAWEDIFLWRSHMFSAISTNFHWTEPATLATLHDRPWTSIRMAQTARRQKLREVALLSLNKLTAGAMDVSDAFSKLREQILSYYNSDDDLERKGGLNLVNTTNLQFFNSLQKSELFRLKAGFLASLCARSKANQAYCHAVQICPSYARAWGCWGVLCSSLATLTENATDSDPSKEAAATSAKKVAQYLAQAMGCYIETVQCDSHELNRNHLPACLWMLVKDGPTPGVLCQTLENRGYKLPPWVWLPWIPQLLTSLCRIEARAVKKILNSIVEAHPQALYFSLRAFFLERRDIERSRGSTPSGSYQQYGGHTAVKHSEDLMSALRKAHPTLWSSLEPILEELIVRFRPSYEEELLATIAALLQRADSQLEHQKKDNSEKSEDNKNTVLLNFTKTLGRVSAKFFRSPQGETASNAKDDRTRKTSEFKMRYKEAFEKDFLISGSDGTGPDSAEAISMQNKRLTLDEIIEKLKKWKLLLETKVSATPSSIPLQQASPSLSSFSSESPDLWSGACDSRAMGGTSLDHDGLSESDIGVVQSSPSSSSAAAAAAARSSAKAVAEAAEYEGGGGNFGGGSAAVEIPGQYVPNCANVLDSKPRPELHAKLVKFESTLEIMQKNEQLVRRIGMVGSDGKTYRFLLQFAIPYWTRTDERTAQLHYLIAKLLRRDVIASRRQLSMKPSVVIPIAQRLRMTVDDRSHLSLDDIYKAECDSRGESCDAISTYFQVETRRLLHEREQIESTGSQKSDADAERAAKLEIFKKVCNDKVERDFLLRHMQATLRGSEQLFQFRRAFTGELAANSLLQYAFGVVERSPTKFVLSIRNAQVLSPDFRFHYNAGYLVGHDEEPKMPFRMTRNIEEFIGPFLLNGCFIPSFTSVASAINSHKDEIDPALSLLLRDDIVSWYTSKSTARNDAKLQELERQLADRVTKNVKFVQDRVERCTPQTTKPKQPDQTNTVDSSVKELLKAATSEENLCMMSPVYQAWL